MANTVLLQPDPDPAVYQIRTKGQLGRAWADWFGGLPIRREPNRETLELAQSIRPRSTACSAKRATWARCCLRSRRSAPDGTLAVRMQSAAA